jgi:hypothetical protein
MDMVAQKFQSFQEIKDATARFLLVISPLKTSSPTILPRAVCKTWLTWRQFVIASEL